MRLIGSPEYIEAMCVQRYPELPEVLARVRERVPYYKREVYRYQAAALFTLARKFNSFKANFLEIGTARGYTAAIMAEAAPKANIVTLNVRDNEIEEARQHLAPYRNVTVVKAVSWDYLKEYRGPGLHFVFVDGDHKRIKKDLPWYSKVLPGGMMVFHDYAPAGTRRACPPVYDALNEFSRKLGQDFDVLVVDDGGVGFVGFCKRE